MPEGVEVAVSDDGLATIDFVDPSRRGPGLAALLEHCEPSDIEKLTGVGPRSARYRAPAKFAKAAGLLDKASRVDELEVADTSSATDATGSVAPSAEDHPSDGPADSGVEHRPAAEQLPPPGRTYDDGLPDMDWSRQAINNYGAALTPPVDVTGEPNKRAAIAAIAAAASRLAPAP